DESGITQPTPEWCARKVESAASFHVPPQSCDGDRIAVGEIEHEALEVRCLGNIHRRARCLQGFGCPTDPVAAAPEKLVEHVVLVGRNDQAADWKPHLSGDVTGEHVAEI